MKNILAATSALAVCLSLSGHAAFALSEDEKNALGAIAILGLAALAHNKNHYHERYQPADSNATARFERGYRDGLHNEPYASRHSNYDYGQGYDAGQKERSNRLAHKQRNIQGTKVPVAALRSCQNEAAASWGVGKHDVHVINAGQEGSDSYYIEFASGHRHVICGTNSSGQVFNLRNGRL